MKNFIKAAVVIIFAFGFVRITNAASETLGFGSNGINITNDSATQTTQLSVLDNTDGIYVAWHNNSAGGNPTNNQGVFIQRYNNSGVAIWGSPVRVFNETFTLSGLVQDGNGGVVVSGTTQVSTTSVARLNSSGSILWNVNPGISALRTSIDKDTANNIFVLAGERIQKMDISGNLLWGVNGIDYFSGSSTASDHFYMSPLDNGGVSTVWVTASSGTSKIYGQVLDSTGATLPANIEIAIDPTKYAGVPSVEKADGNNFYVLYAEQTGLDAPDAVLKLKRYNTSGVNQLTSSGVVISSNSFDLSESDLATRMNLFPIYIDTASGNFVVNSIYEGRLFKVSTSGSILWNKLLSMYSVYQYSWMGTSFSLNKDEFAAVQESSVLGNNAILHTFDYTTGIYHTGIQAESLGGAVSVTNMSLLVDSQGNYLSSYLANSEVYIQKFTPQNYEDFQINNVPSLDNDVTNYNSSILNGSVYGLNGGSFELIVKDSGLTVAGIASVNMTADRSWSTLVAESDLVDKKSYFGGLSGLEGVVSANYDLYVPRSAETLVGICPNATNISQVTLTCDDIFSLSTSDAGVSIVSIEGQSYWKIANTTYPGAISVPAYRINNLSSDLNVVDITNGASLESGDHYGNYSVRLTSVSKVVAELDINITANLDWSALTVGLTETVTFLNDVTSLPGFVGPNYSIFTSRNALDTNVYTCPNASSFGQIEFTCTNVVDLGLSAVNLSQETISSGDYWKYSNFTGNNLARVFEEVILGDVLIVYQDNIGVNSSAQNMYDLLDGLGYDVTIYENEGVPAASVLNSYRSVLYTQGDTYTLDDFEIESLKEYMNFGRGRIFFEGEEIIYDASNDVAYPSFIENHLRSTDEDQDAGDILNLTVTDTTHPVTLGLPLNSTHSGDSGYSDKLNVINGATALIDADFGTVLSAYDNGLNCTDAKKTVLFAGVWRNAALGIDDVTFRNTLLTNTVDWLLYNPCTVTNLDADYNLTTQISSATVDLTDPGANGNLVGNLTSTDGKPLANIDIELNSNISWSTLSLLKDAATGKMASINLIDLPGVGNSYSLYLQIPESLESLNEIRICPNINSLSELVSSCTSGITFIAGESKTAFGGTVAANKISVDGTLYWLVTGLRNNVGIFVVPADSTDNDEETGGTGGPGGTGGTIGSGAGSLNTGDSASLEEPSDVEIQDPNDIDDLPIDFVVDSETLTPNTPTDQKPTTTNNNSFLGVTLDSLTPGIILLGVTAGISTIFGLANYYAYFFGIIFWKRNKYWGLVYDEYNQAPKGLVTIRAYKKTTQGYEFVAQTISDFDGRYGLNIADPGEYRVEFKAGGFKDKNIIVTVQKQQDLVLDMGLSPLSEQELNRYNFVQRVWRQHAQVIMQIFRAVALILMILGLFNTLNIISSNPSISNYLVALLYLGFAILQLSYLAYPYWQYSQSGSIVDSESKTPIKGAIIRIYSLVDQKNSIKNVGISNSAGIIKLKTQPGRYNYQLFKSGYKSVDGVTQIDKAGKLIKPLVLEKLISDVNSRFGQ